MRKNIYEKIEIFTDSQKAQILSGEKIYSG